MRRFLLRFSYNVRDQFAIRYYQNSPCVEYFQKQKKGTSSLLNQIINSRRHVPTISDDAGVEIQRMMRRFYLPAAWQSLSWYGPQRIVPWDKVLVLVAN